jgi:putative membrane protein
MLLGTHALFTTVQAQAPTTGSTHATSEHSAMDHSTMEKDKSAKQAVTAQSFVTQAATTDLAEIEFSQLALQNSKDASVKQFAEQMVKDHTASSAKLKTLAAKNNLTLPAALDADHAAVKTKLAALQGQQFDREYGKQMAKGHDKAVALFESAAQAPQINGDLKQFAATTLPKLKEHKGMAHDLHGKEGA